MGAGPPRTPDVRTALAAAVEHLPGGRLVLLTRKPLGSPAITWIGGAVETVTGHPPEAFVADPGFFARVVHADDRERVLDEIGRLPGRDTVELSYRMRTAGGEERTLRETLRVVRSDRGNPVEIVGILEDLTDTRALERQVAALEDRLWQSQRVESVGALAGGIAHDFNNLLTAILSSSQLIAEESSLSAQARRDLAVIHHAAARGGALVRQILSFSSRTSMNPQALALPLVITDMEGLLKRTLGADVEMRVKVAQDLWPVHADVARVEQVLMNLIVNAREAMPGGGRLEIRAVNHEITAARRMEGQELRPGRYVRLTVTDTGPGVPDDVARRIFEPFFTTKGGDRAGAGVGLATVLRIARGYGGAVELDQTAGSGATFHVYLPIEGAESPIPEAGLAETAARSAPDAFRVLVVEDDQAVRDIVQRALEADGYSVVAVGSAEEAVRVFDRVRPAFDLLISDVVLPDRSGPELYRALSRRVGTLPVLFMSGYGTEVLTRSGLASSDASFIRKPFKPATLTEKVRELVARGRRPDQPQRDVGNGG